MLDVESSSHCKCWVLDRGEVGGIVDALVVKEFLLPGGYSFAVFYG